MHQVGKVGKVGGTIRKRASTAFTPVHFHKDREGEKHILYYDPKTLFNFGFISPKGSVINWAIMFRIILMCLIATFVSQFRCSDKPTHYSFCFPILANAEGLIFASLVTFLLGLFVSTTFSRWWSMREKIGVIVNNIGLLTMLTSHLVLEDSHLKDVLKKLRRYMHLAHALVYKYANGSTDFDDLETYNLATKEEMAIFNRHKTENLPAMVFGWAMHCLSALMPSGQAIPWPPAIGSIQNAFNAANDLDALLKSQMPYAYLHLLTITTKIHLGFVVFYAGGIIASGIAGYQWNRIVFGYVVIIANYLIYEGLLRIHNILFNPLGSDKGDFPTNLFVSSCYQLNLALLESPPEEEEQEQKEKEREKEKEIEMERDHKEDEKLVKSKL